MADAPLIVAGARTPFSTWAHGERGDGQRGGALRAKDPFDLGAAALRGALARARLLKPGLDFVAFGNAYQVGPHGCYAGRYVTHRAGLPPETTSVGVNLACGAGLQALGAAADAIARGRARWAAAVGADSPSNVRRDVFVPSFKDLSCGRHIADAAADAAESLGIGRAEQDAWAARSHARASAALERGLFADEIAPVDGIDRDDAVRRDANAGHFERARALREGSPATHANTHAIVDGGSALLLASPEAAREAQAAPLGALLGVEVVGLKPEGMAFGSVRAIRALLARLGWEERTVDLFEINETFASQMLVGLRELGLPPEKVNVNGGAIALGHPFAGTGCRLVHTLLLELGRRRLRRGVAAICVGGGLGIAAAVERL